MACFSIHAHQSDARMLRLAALVDLLGALVSPDHVWTGSGAHTAVLTLPGSAELYAYATMLGAEAPTPSRVRLMAPDAPTPLEGVEWAQSVSAVATTAWREEQARKEGAKRAARRPPPSPSMRTQSSARDDPSPSPNPGARGSTLRTGTTDAQSLDDGSDSDAPVLIECELGRLLVLPVYVPGMSQGPEAAHPRRRRRAKTAPHSRHARHASGSTSTNSASGEGGTSRAAHHGHVAGSALEGTDIGEFSTEEEVASGQDTEPESARSSDVGGRHGPSLLLTLNSVILPAESGAYEINTAPETAWHALYGQARMFSDSLHSVTAGTAA